MRYPYILLDVGETLIGPRTTFGAVYAQVVAEQGIAMNAGRLERGLRRTWEEFEHEIPSGTDRYRHYHGGEGEYWRLFTRRTLEQASDGAVDESLVAATLDGLRAAFNKPAAWRVYPDVPPVLTALAADGVRLGVVSNWDSRLPRVLEMLDLARHFNAVGVSHLEGVEKPDPELFLRVLRRLGARPDQALHVGDVAALDLVGARAAGIDCLLVDRRGGIEDALAPLHDLTDLPRIASGEMEPRWPAVDWP